MASSSGFVTQRVKTEYNENDYENSGDFRDIYYHELQRMYEAQSGAVRGPWTNEKVVEVIQHLKNAQVSIESGARRTNSEYYWSKKYEVMSVGDQDYLILKKVSPDRPSVRVVPVEEYYDILLYIHQDCGHGGRDKIKQHIKDTFIITRKAIDLFVSLCPVCESKRGIPKKAKVVKQIVPRDFNEWGQVNLIDLQSSPDGEFKWLLNYQDYNTNFIHLRPLCSSTASEVATELLKIFLEFGTPCTLQSDNGQEFTLKIIEEIRKNCPECNITHSNPQHLHTQGSIEWSNQDVESMLHKWMRDNNSTKWAMGCYFVQYSKNTSFNRIIGSSPYQALFGCEPKLNLSSSSNPNGITQQIKTEEQTEITITEFKPEPMDYPDPLETDPLNL